MRLSVTNAAHRKHPLTSAGTVGSNSLNPENSARSAARKGSDDNEKESYERVCNSGNSVRSGKHDCIRSSSSENSSILDRLRIYGKLFCRTDLDLENCAWPRGYAEKQIPWSSRSTYWHCLPDRSAHSLCGLSVYAAHSGLLLWCAS